MSAEPRTADDGARDLSRAIVATCRRLGIDARAVEVRKVDELSDGRPVYLATIGDGIVVPRAEYLVALGPEEGA